MDKGIQLNIQLPLEELGRFSHLLDQLQNLMAAAGTGAREPEGSSTFDPQRFQQLMQAEQQSRGEDPTASQVTAAASQAEISGSLPEAAAARSDLSSMPEIPTAEAAISPLQEAPAARSDTSFLAEPPTAQGDMSPMGVYWPMRLTTALPPPKRDSR